MMGWSPDQVDRCSLWQFAVAWRGWRRANTVPSGPQAPTEAEHEAALARVHALG